MVLFHDGAEVPFYLNKHNRARKTLTHVYLMNEEAGVKFEIQAFDSPTASPPMSQVDIINEIGLPDTSDRASREF
jgi:hypothetical protein